MHSPMCSPAYSTTTIWTQLLKNLPRHYIWRGNASLVAQVANSSLLHRQYIILTATDIYLPLLLNWKKMFLHTQHAYTTYTHHSLIRIHAYIHLQHAHACTLRVLKLLAGWSRKREVHVFSKGTHVKVETLCP